MALKDWKKTGSMTWERETKYSKKYYSKAITINKISNDYIVWLYTDKTQIISGHLSKLQALKFVKQYMRTH